MVVLVQAAMLTIARSAADAATSQAARRVSVLGTSPAEAEDALIEMLLATVPGAVAADTEVAVSSDGVTASARTRWVPPGPDLFDLWITTTSTATAVSPP
ncbi:MAG: hypothetical protein HKN93_05050 [Acidimicrobiia bacterium]|nr:hypothetical protein [Acidimicrobiia bacterium]